MVKIALLGLFIFSSLLMADSARDKQEIMALKKELNEFYDLKEKEYQKQKQEIDMLTKKVEAQKKEIADLHEKNKQILKDIEGAVASKTSKIYGSMKPKVAADIFNAMIDEGKIKDVFDIIIILKEQKVTAIMKFLTVKNASALTEMLQKFKQNDNTDTNKKGK